MLLMPYVAVLNVIMLNVINAICCCAECRYAECHHAKCRGAEKGEQARKATFNLILKQQKTFFGLPRFLLWHQ